MKAKAKPTKGSARTKRFDRGGTVGALAGLGTLAYLLNKKGSEGSTSSDESPAKPKVAEIAPRESTSDEKQAKANMGEPAKSEMYKAEPGVGEGKAAKPIARSRPASQTFPQTKSKAVEPEASSVRDISQSPRLSDMSKVRSMAEQNAQNASERRGIVEKQEQARLADLAKSGPVSEKEMQKSRGRLSTVRGTDARAKAEFDKRNDMISTFGMKKGGKVKKYAEGGLTSADRKAMMQETVKAPKSGKKDTGQAEIYTASKGKPPVDDDMGSIQTKKYAKGGSVTSASRRADGIALRGKTRA
jgi:hypothetical protein